MIVAVAWAHAADAPGAAAGDPASTVRLEVLLPLLLVTAVYVVGWWRLSRRAPAAVSGHRSVLALAGIAAVVVALLSPLDALADRLFVAHMIQHMLLIMVAAPLLLLANPFPVMLWALPHAMRAGAGGWFRRARSGARLVRIVTVPWLAWLAFAVIVWGWHVPAAYDAALSGRWLHDAEHVALFAAAVLFWWPVVHPAPRVRAPLSAMLKVLYVVLAAFHTAALGLLLTLAPVLVYRSYVTTTTPYGLSALEDQMWGGMIMWAVGGLVDMIVVLVLVHRALSATSSPGLPAAQRS